MTDAAFTENAQPQAHQGRKRRGGLWVNDTELCERLNVDPKLLRQALSILDRDPKLGFPQKQKLWGNKRYWPAVEAYFEAHYGSKILPSNGRKT